MDRLHVTRRLPGGQGLAPVLRQRAPTLTLDWDRRQRSRLAVQDDGGRELAIVLPRGELLRGGDVLLAEDGSLLRVVAAPQPVLVVTPCREHGQAFDLMRAAYHLGNRHVALQLGPDRLLLEPDPVLAELLRRMHLDVREAVLPFEPESGAYGQGALLGHGHGHGETHEHSHEHSHVDAGHDDVHPHA